MTNKTPPTQVKDWLIFINIDLLTARAAMKDRIYAAVCFHAQQAVEKVIKAYLVNQRRTYPKIHNLGGLLDIKPPIRKTFHQWQSEIKFLDQFYVPTRYPEAIAGSLPAGLPNKDDAQKALQFAKAIVKFVKTTLLIPK